MPLLTGKPSPNNVLRREPERAKNKLILLDTRYASVSESLRLTFSSVVGTKTGNSSTLPDVPEMCGFPVGILPFPFSVLELDKGKNRPRYRCERLR